jgi:hypothetical protein
LWAIVGAGLHAAGLMPEDTCEASTSQSSARQGVALSIGCPVHAEEGFEIARLVGDGDAHLGLS